MPNSSIDDETLSALIQRAQGEGELDRGQLVAALEELRSRRSQRELDEQLRRGQARLMKLARSEELGRGNLRASLREITQAAAELLEVGRASMWRYNDEHTGIVCVELYIAEQGEHDTGLQLAAADFPRYFAAIAEERVIAADDALTDPRTSEFAELYLGPLGIGSLLDAPVRVGGRMSGIVCFEHIGPKREWSVVDQQLASWLADFCALAIEADQRRKVEDELRESIVLAEGRLETIERQRMAIADLSAPIIDVWDGVLVLPIVGLVDTQRSLELTERLLERIAGSGASSVIVDLTGVDVVDTMTANHLLQMIRAAALLGAFCVLSGISPLIAQTLVQLDVDLSEIATVRSLKEGLQTCLRRKLAQA